MRITLAPLEGVLDFTLRELLTQLGGYDLCITEFIRISNHQLLPDKVFYRMCPELHNGGKTQSGTPVRIQLLGSQPEALADNAFRAIGLGSQGIDMNFGCPAKMVNKNKGGAALLKEPEIIYQTLDTIRKNIQKDAPLSAKIRLGWDDPESVFDIMAAVHSAGVNEVTIHARTKLDGYKAEAIKWNTIARVKQQYPDMHIIANGEIWNKEDAVKCQLESNCEDIMIGRGALSTPNLAAAIKHDKELLTWPEIIELVLAYSHVKIRGDKGWYYSNRIKQWLLQLKKQYPQAEELFTNIRRLKYTPEVVAEIESFQQSLIK